MKIYSWCLAVNCYVVVVVVVVVVAGGGVVVGGVAVVVCVFVVSYFVCFVNVICCFFQYRTKGKHMLS